jgi:general secretion pathway protein M
MTANLTRAWREHKGLRAAAFLAGNLAAGLAVALLIVMPARDLFAERDARIAERRTLLARLAAVAAEESRVQAAAREAEHDAAHDEFLIGPNEGVIVADLQTRLKAIAEAAGARLRAVQSLPPKTTDDIRYVGAKLDLYGPVEAIQRALHAVETGRPYLFVGAAVIRGAPPVNAQAPGHVAAQAPVLDAQLDIFGAVQIKGRDQ